MTKIIKDTNVAAPVVQLKDFTANSDKIYVCKIGNRLGKLNYDHAEAHWNNLHRTDSDFGNLGNHKYDTLAAIKEAVNKGYEVYELDGLTELAEWILANKESN